MWTRQKKSIKRTSWCTPRWCAPGRVPPLAPPRYATAVLPLDPFCPTFSYGAYQSTTIRRCLPPVQSCLWSVFYPSEIFASPILAPLYLGARRHMYPIAPLPYATPSDGGSISKVGGGQNQWPDFFYLHPGPAVALREILKGRGIIFTFFLRLFSAELIWSWLRDKKSFAGMAILVLFE